MWWEDICRSENASLWRMPDGTLTPRIHPAPVGVLPGSFDPLHAGHRGLRAAAEEWLGGLVFYEMTITNADKPPLDAREVERRCGQFEEHPVWITNAPTFVRKAELSPGRVFVVGADTAVRIVDSRFYGGREQAMHAALHQIRETGCRFLVAGRLFQDRFLTTWQIPVPSGFDDLFETLPESRFRRDVSSSELRRPMRNPTQFKR